LAFGRPGRADRRRETHLPEERVHDDRGEKISGEADARRVVGPTQMYTDP
jgi:hypothetical protein